METVYYYLFFIFFKIKSFRSDYEGWKPACIASKENGGIASVLEVTMRDGNIIVNNNV